MFLPHRISFLQFAVAAAALFTASVLPVARASAADQVRVDGQTLLGRIVEGSAAGLRVSTTTGERIVPARQIGPVVFDGEPPPLQKLRDDYFSGRYTAASAAAEELASVPWSSPVMAAEAMFLPAIAAVRASLAGEDLDLATAESKLQTLATEAPNSFRRYEAAKALAESATARGDSAALRTAASLLPTGDDPSLDAERGLWRGQAALIEEDFSAADQAFRESAASAANAADAALIFQAQLGLAAAGRDAAAAVRAVEKLIDQLSADETRSHAQAYLTLGRLQERAGAPVDAALAYLHNDVLFAEHPVEYVASLRRLVPLWRELGRNDRSEKTAAELRRSYPQFASSD